MRMLVIGIILGVLGSLAYDKYRDRAAERQRIEDAGRYAPQNATVAASLESRATGRMAVESPDSAPAPAPAFDVEAASPPSAAREAAASSEPAYRCDGREHCSQMRSCAEAHWMLRNCAGMKMDGDGDGEPCERGPC